MKSTLRRVVEAYLKAEGRLSFKQLGSAETPSRESSGAGAAILRESLKQTSAFQMRIQWTCVGLLCLVFLLQSMFVIQGFIADSPRIILMGGLGLVLLPVIWALRRIWIDIVLTKLIQDVIRDLHAEDAVMVIEMIYRVLTSRRRAPLQTGTAPPSPGPGPENVRKTAILFMASEPTNASRLGSGKELREIQENLECARLRDRFVLHQRFAVRQTDLSQALLNTRPEIVHFSGHGAADGALCLEDEQRLIQRVTPNALSGLFLEFPTIRCVLLNACYTEDQAKAIAQHIELVIGTRGPLLDEAAILFAVGFYQGLGAGCSFEQAYRLGLSQMEIRYPGQEPPSLVRRER